MVETRAQKVYFEKQGEDMLCGLHCVNSMLQGPYFDEVTLAQIGLELDQEEASLLGAGEKGYKTGNVAMDGMFNVQVLSRALQ